MAIKWGRVIAAAATSEELDEQLEALGVNFHPIAFDWAGKQLDLFGEWLGWSVMEALVGHWNECVTPPAEEN